MRRWLRVALLSSWVAGCTSAPPQPAQGPGLNLAQAATVWSGWWGAVYRGGRVTLDSVGTAKRNSQAQREFLIPPGKTIARASISLCTGERFCVPLSDVEVPFEAQARHTYRIRAAEKVHGRKEFWVWIEDVASEQVVGGTKGLRDAARN
jgi:hypothetical protein